MLGAAAGAFLVIGVIAFVAEANNDDPTTPGVVFSLILIAAALVAGTRAPGPLRSACVTAIVLAVPALWFFGFFGGGDTGRGEIRGVYLLTLFTYAVLYVFAWTKGRAVFLAGVLIVFASWAGFEVADSSSSVIPFQSGVTSSNGSANLGVDAGSPFASEDDSTDSTATVSLVIGLAFLAVGAMLDRRRYEGAATPFVAVGAFETLVGAIVLGGNDSVLLGGLLAIGAGAVVGLVAGRGDRRRATMWIGVLAIFGGCVAVLVDIAPSSAAGVGGIAFGFALGARLARVVAGPGARRARRRLRAGSPTNRSPRRRLRDGHAPRRRGRLSRRHPGTPAHPGTPRTPRFRRTESAEDSAVPDHRIGDRIGPTRRGGDARSGCGRRARAWRRSRP